MWGLSYVSFTSNVIYEHQLHLSIKWIWMYLNIFCWKMNCNSFLLQLEQFANFLCSNWIKGVFSEIGLHSSDAENQWKGASSYSFLCSSACEIFLNHQILINNDSIFSSIEKILTLIENLLKEWNLAKKSSR